MISNPFFLISILISALIAFVTVKIVVESTLILFNISRGRVRAFLRLLPFISLLLDLILSGFSIGSWLNPLSCSSCVQKILLTLFFPELKNYLAENEISLINYLGTDLSHAVFSAAFISFLAMMIYSVARIIFETAVAARSLGQISQSKERCNRPIENALLAAAIKEKKVDIFILEDLKVPLATYSKEIIIPKDVVECLSQMEFEAVIAHELEHIICRDSVVRLISHFISAIFWWVPTQEWQMRLEFDQEIACDQSVLKYDIKQDYLASALLKVTVRANARTNVALCYLAQKQHPSLRRVHMMLGETPLCPKYWHWIDYAVITICPVLGLVCGWWK